MATPLSRRDKDGGPMISIAGKRHTNDGEGPSPKSGLRATSAPEASDPVICTVNGRSVTLGKIASVLKVAGRWSLIDEAIRQALLEEALDSGEVAIGDDELQRFADGFRTERKLHTADDTAAWLRAHNMSDDDFEHGLLRGLTLAKLRESIEYDEVRRCFFGHLKSFQWARFCQIVTKERDTAEELLAQIRDDEADFASLARRYSIDPSSRAAGGYVGAVKRRDLDPQLEAVVFSGVLEAVLGPVQTPLGWHLIKVWERGGSELDDETAAAAREAVLEHRLKRRADRASIQVSL